jgi:hypothetical protein
VEPAGACESAEQAPCEAPGVPIVEACPAAASAAAGAAEATGCTGSVANPNGVQH